MTAKWQCSRILSNAVGSSLDSLSDRGCPCVCCTTRSGFLPSLPADVHVDVIVVLNMRAARQALRRLQSDESLRIGPILGQDMGTTRLRAQFHASPKTAGIRMKYHAQRTRAQVLGIRLCQDGQRRRLTTNINRFVNEMRVRPRGGSEAKETGLRSIALETCVPLPMV